MKLLTFIIVFTLILSAPYLQAQSPAITATKAAITKRLLIVGDSLTEGYGVARESAYPALVEKMLNAQKDSLYQYQVLNSGISGSTSASAVSRVKWVLKDAVDSVNQKTVLVLALGANDGLRGQSTAGLEKNLSDAIKIAQDKKVEVILAGMMMPPNYGATYSKDFGAVFPRVAKKYNIKLIPFLLKDVAGVSSLNIPDGLHPNEKGHQKIAENILSYLK